MHGLTIVAMAEELHDGLGGDFDLDRSAAALDLGHCVLLRLKGPSSAKAPPCARSNRNVCQPDRVLADTIARHKAERRPGAGEEWLAATKHDRAKIESILVDETKVGQASRELRSAKLDLAAELSL